MNLNKSAYKDRLRKCEHCNTLISKTAYYRHKLKYFDNVSNRWTKESHVEKSKENPNLEPEGPSECDQTRDQTPPTLDHVVEANLLFNPENESESEAGDKPDNDIVETEIWEDEDLNEAEAILADREAEVADEETEIKNGHALIKLITFFIFMWQKMYNISNNAVDRLFAFIKLLFSTIGLYYNIEVLATLSDELPSSITTARKRLGIDRDAFIKYVVCPSCQQIYRFEDCYTYDNRNLVAKTCQYIRYPNHTHSSQRKRCGSQLLKRVVGKKTKQVQKVYLYPIRVFCYQSPITSLKRLLKSEEFKKHCNEWQHLEKSDRLSDIYDGNVWRELEKEGYFSISNNLAFTFNLDWFQPFDHTIHSIGAYYLMINNLPHHLRIKPDNCLIVGLMEGPDEPKKTVNQFLSPLVEDLKKLQVGVHIKDSSTVGNIYRGVLICVANDIPACRKCLGFLGHSAKFGCSKCMKAFPHEFGSKADYSDFNIASPRTHKHHKESALMVLKAKNKAEEEKLERETGCRWTEFFRLEYFQPVRNHILDPMHNLYLGSAKHVTQLFIDKDVIDKQKFEIIQNRVDNIKLPTGYGCIPSKIKSGFSALTADQWKIWVNVCSLVVLKDIIPNRHYDMWSCFVQASKLLSQRSVSHFELDQAHSVLILFCQKFAKLFPNNCTMNMHLHMHLIKCIKDYGPIHATWCFPFERLNGVLGSYSTNNHSVPIQMMRKFITSQELVVINPGELYEPFGNLMKDKLMRGSSRPSFETFSTHLLRTSQRIHTLDFEAGQFFQILPPAKLDMCSSTDIEDLNLMFTTMYNTSCCISQMVVYIERVIYCGQLFAVLDSRGSRSSCIQAKWLSFANGNVQMDPSSDATSGVIRSIMKCHVTLNGQEKEHIVLEVDWFRPHEYGDFFGCGGTVTSVQTEKCANSARFIPVQRVLHHCALYKEKIKLPSGKETVHVSIPI